MIQENKIAEYFNVVPELVPFIPELLTDLWELGSSPELILQWIHDFDLPPDLIRVLDMGCGKGAVSISLAKKFDFQVKGIDFFEPFLKEAEKKAKEFNVSTLCQFCLADIREAVLSETEYNMVIYTAIGSVLGSLDQSIGKLRLTVNEGGLIIIDDGFLKNSERIDFPGYRYCGSYKDTVDQLTSYGDQIIKEKVFSTEEIRFINQQNTDWISKRADNLAQQFPRQAELFYDFVENEKKECKILEHDVNCAVWMIQKV